MVDKMTRAFVPLQLHLFPPSALLWVHDGGRIVPDWERGLSGLFLGVPGYHSHEF